MPFIVSKNVELKHASHDINPPQHNENKHRRGIIYHKTQFMPLQLMLLTSSIHYKILSTFSATQREKQRETVQLTTQNATVTIKPQNYNNAI